MALLQDTVPLTFLCECLPGNSIDGHDSCQLGIQNRDIPEQMVAADAETAQFELNITLLLDTVAGTIDYKGSYVNGKRGERFTYFVWGFESELGWVTVRRAKFYLNSITPVQWNSALTLQAPVKVRFNMTGPKNQPLTASIKPTHFEVLA
jgi:Family of unknown function (DUF5990)